jgi:hypothetical protein
MQSIGDLAKWRVIKDGESLTFDDEKPRRVRFEVNVPGQACLHVTPILHGEILEKECQFLAFLAGGLDIVEFQTPGAFLLTAEGVVHLHTHDGTAAHVPKTDERVFAKIIERRARNYQLELMEKVAEINLQKRLNEVAGEVEARMRARLDEKDGDDEKASDRAAGAGKPKAKRPKSSERSAAGSGDSEEESGDESDASSDA